jgi:hypothetical protein
VPDPFPDAGTHACSDNDNLDDDNDDDDNDDDNIGSMLRLRVEQVPLFRRVRRLRGVGGRDRSDDRAHLLARMRAPRALRLCHLLR